MTYLGKVAITIALAAGFVVSCSQPPLAQLASACSALAVGYNTAAGFKAQGKLSASTIAAITALEGPAKAVCNTSAPPTDIPTALTTVTNAVSVVTAANAGVK